MMVSSRNVGSGMWIHPGSGMRPSFNILGMNATKRIKDLRISGISARKQRNLSNENGDSYRFQPLDINWDATRTNRERTNKKWELDAELGWRP